MKEKIINQGEKFNGEFCPKCNDRLIVKMKDEGTQVFECENCKFKIEKNEK